MAIHYLEMLFTFLICLFCQVQAFAFPEFETKAWEIRNTEIYRPFNRNEVVAGSNGDVFFFETGKSTLRHYDKEGVLKGSIGREGSGPGEFRGIVHAWYDATSQHLFVMGQLTHFHVFKSDGQFVETIRFPKGRIVFPNMVRNGWVYFHTDYPSNKRQLILTDYLFKNDNSLYSWEEAQPKMTQEGAQLSVKVGVAVDAAKVAVNADHNLIFLYLPGKPEIKMIDTLSGREKGVIQLGLTPLPIDSSWVERKLDNDSKQGDPVKLEYTIGEHFPLIKSLRIGPLGNLLVYTSIHYVKQNEVPLVFDQRGQELKTEFSGAALQRIVAIYDNMAIVTTFDSENEEAGLARINVSDVNVFVESRP